MCIRDRQRGIKLEVEVPEEELLASVDKEALTKILSNLFANALKSARTYVYLHLSVVEKHEVFTISLSNDGNIVPIEMRENIFKAFVHYRDGKDIVSGTGIGLACLLYTSGTCVSCLFRRLLAHPAGHAGKTFLFQIEGH